MPGLTLAEVRPRAAQALAPASPDDPLVYVDYPDAVDVPCLFVYWDNPWLTYRTACLWDVELSILQIAGRIEAGPGIDTIERLAQYTIERLRADSQSWAFSSSQAPAKVDIANIPYLAGRINYRVPVTT